MLGQHLPEYSLRQKRQLKVKLQQCLRKYVELYEVNEF
jgi:hypothetical protein